METAEIKDLALKLMFKLSDAEAQDIQSEFSLLAEQIALMNKVDTQGVEPQIYPFAVETEFMREDTANHLLSRDAALANAKKVKAGHIVVPKVVK